MNPIRFDALKEAMRAADLNQMLVTDTASLFYLTGRWIEPGERLLALHITPDAPPTLLINRLFPVAEVEGIRFQWYSDTEDPVALLAQTVDVEKTLGVDKNWPSGFLVRLMEQSGLQAFTLGSLLVDRLRSIKDPQEIRFMEEASRINDAAMERLIQCLAEGVTEQAMEERLRTIYQELGADGFSFEPIIAFGENGADPHHANGQRRLRRGDAVVLDIGCRKDHYCADMTRTVFYGALSPRQEEIYAIVLEANQRAIDTVRPGVRFQEIDAAARGHIEEKGYGDRFTHRTGHSIGIEVHDYGDVSAVNTEVLQPGMIFSVEPGIYLPGEFGVRIEDLVLVTEEGHQNLNGASKEPTVVG